MTDSKGSTGSFADAFDTAFERLESDVLAACGKGEEWTAKVASGVCAALNFAGRDPDAARVLTIDVLLDRGDGPHRFEGMIESLADQLREVKPEDAQTGAVTEGILVGAIIGLVRMRVSLGEAETLRAAAPEAAHFVLSPYIGPAEAKRVVTEQGG